MSRLLWLFALAFAAPLLASAQLAPTPPMGWNSWDSYGLTITEAEFKQNVQWFNAHLKPYGWRYVVIDEGWYLAHPENAGKKGADQGYTMDANGRYTPAPDRFPSAANGAGLRPIAAYAHSLGLKFGIHIIRGIPKQAVERNLAIAGSKFHAAEAADTTDTCRWNPDNYGLKDNAAAQAYYDSIAKLYAGWGVDFVKVDCISSPYKQAEIHMMSAALKKTGRLIVLSLSPGPTPLEDAQDVMKQAQMWRISNDFWDVWGAPSADIHGFPQSATRQFLLLSQWEQFAAPGHWPDADMLPFGTLGPRPGWQQARKSRLTPEEMRTVFTLWSMARSPLVLGANLTEMDPSTEALLTNREVIAVNQQSTGNKALLHTPTSWIWTAKPATGGGTYLAVFNTGDQRQTIEYMWSDLGMSAGKHAARDLWAGKQTGTTDRLSVTLPAHQCVLYRVQ